MSWVAINNRYDALVYATRAHDGQRDKSDTEDYILHPIRVAEYVEPLGEDFVIVALLHDVIEDCGHYAQRHPMQVGEHIYEALDRLTHRDNERYTDYIDRVCGQTLACYVKLADLYHNSHGRPAIPGDSADRAHERFTKYEAARDRIWIALGREWNPIDRKDTP